MAKRHLLPSVRRRKLLKAKNPILYEQILDVFYRHDPIAIASKLDEDNRDEYEPEVDTILVRLQEAESDEALTQIIHEEFVQWFSPGIASSREDYSVIAKEIWELWRRSGFQRPNVSWAS